MSAVFHVPSFGNPLIDQDHNELARLFESGQGICRHLSTPAHTCDACPAGTRKVCSDSLADICNKTMLQLLGHFQREDALMNSLPDKPEVELHCTAHRSEHLNFTTRFNRLVTQINTSDPKHGLRDLNAFILKWADVVLRYDNELLALLKANSARGADR